MAVCSSQSDTLTCSVEGKGLADFVELAAFHTVTAHSSCRMLPNVRILSLSMVHVTTCIWVLIRSWTSGWSHTWPGLGMGDLTIQCDNRFPLVCLMSSFPIHPAVCSFQRYFVAFPQNKHTQHQSSFRRES